MFQPFWIVVFTFGVGLFPLSAVAWDEQHDSNVRPPNIVLINLDDADYRMFTPDLLDLYPGIKQLSGNSISFTNMHVTTPFCGPSRASLFRGQYAHRTGIRVNIPESPLSLSFNGGYSEFLRQGYDRDELGVWMKRAGYRTMMIGKYHHNGFDFRAPPGWDDFYMSNGGRYQGTYRFTTKDNPNGSNSKNPDDVYRTDQEADDAVRLIRECSSMPDESGKTDGSSHRRVVNGENATSGQAKGQPFFLYLAPLAPHRPVGNDFTKMVDANKYGNWQPDLRIPPSPEFDEAQMSDKPLHRQSPPYSELEIEVLQSEYLSRARAVKSVDDMIVKLLATIQQCGLTDSTYIFFTSDNGYQLGQHRLHNKLDPYQMCTNVPLFVSGPGVTPGQTANHLMAHIDLCPTILELAGAKLPEFLDGKSFANLLSNAGSANERSWRDSIVIENWQSKRNRGMVLPGMYSGLRYYDKVYVEWVTGDKEFYDLANDPFELENVYPKLSQREQQKLKHDLLTSRNVEMDPIVTLIPGPVETGDSPGFIRGRAEDDRVIEKVSLTIQNARSSEYWNGDSWVSDPVTLAADMSADDQQMIWWRYPLQQSDNGVNVNAWATDDQGNESSRESLSITTSSKEPVKQN